MKIKLLLFLFFINSVLSLACDNSTATLNSETDNGDGTYTYVVNICLELSDALTPDAFSFTPSGGTFTSIITSSVIPLNFANGSTTYSKSISGSTINYKYPGMFPNSTPGIWCTPTVTFRTNGRPSKITVMTNDAYVSPACDIILTIPSCTPPATPTITPTSPTCSAAGSSVISNYAATNTYTFSPSGPTVGSGGAISNMAIGTSYTVTASLSGCVSTASSSFSNAAQLSVPSAPTITTSPPNCTSAGISTMSNYVSGTTYTFSPTGPTVGAGGAISGMVIGTPYTVTATLGGCTSLPSNSFTNLAQLGTLPTPTISTATPTCSSPGISTITNYTSGYTYNFNPTGPTVGTSGVISAMVIGTNYTVIATANGCTSLQSNPFSNLAQLTVPPTPSISTVASTCSTVGTSTISNYTSSHTYTFTPVGPTVGSGGLVSGMNPGTPYTVTANLGGCTSLPSNSFNFVSLTQPVLNITNPISVCAPATIDLTSSSIINGSTGILTGGITYWLDLTATNPIVNPNSISIGGSYYIKAVNGICSDIKLVAVTINTCSCPVSLTITNPNPVCSPSSVDLSSPSIVASTGVGSISYWEDAAATTTPVINYNNITVGKTYYIKMSGNGTSGVCTDIKPVIVTINTTPVLSISNPTAVCSPNTVNITASSITAGSTGGGTLTYWKNNLATIPETNPTAISTSATYHIKATTIAGCSDIKPIIVSIGIKPTLTVTNPTSVCSPNTIDLTSSTITAGSTDVMSLTYWLDAATNQILTNAGNISSSNTYYIKAENGNCTDIKPVIVTIKQSPNLVLNNPSVICEPNTVNLLDPSITNGSTNIGTLFYYSDAALLSTITNPSAYNVAGTSTVYIKTTNSNSCSDTKALTVKINPKDEINISNPASLCSNSPLETLTASPIGGTWTGSGIKANGELQPYLAKIGINDYTYTSNGICPNSKTIQITINAKPNLIISKKDTVCEGEEVLLQDISPYTNLTKCTWYFGDNNSSNTLKETKHKYFSSGTYDVTLIGKDDVGCSDTVTEKEFIHVLKRPTANFMFSPLKPTIFNNSIQTTNLSLNGTNYQWDFGDDSKSLLINPSHKYSNTPNIYLISLNAYNKVTSCDHDTTIQIEIFDEIYCYVPNSFTPNGDELNNEFKPILSGSVSDDKYSLYIFNRWGELLFESHNKNIGWDGSFGNEVCLPGTYVWKLEFKDTINKEIHMKTGHINLIN